MQLLSKGYTMRNNVTLSNGRIVAHRPYLSAGVPNGATEAYIMGGGEMTHTEWQEYCLLTAPPAPPKKPTWAEIKQREAA
jgi:hypothetical protein